MPDIDWNPRFTLTEDHIKLLRRASVEWEEHDAYNGHFAQHSKRPYGNSSPIPGDISEIVGRELTEEDAQDLHEQTAQALEIVLTVGEFRPGTYVSDWPERNWRLESDEEESLGHSRSSQSGPTELIPKLREMEEAIEAQQRRVEELDRDLTEALLLIESGFGAELKEAFAPFGGWQERCHSIVRKYGLDLRTKGGGMAFLKLLDRLKEEADR